MRPPDPGDAAAPGGTGAGEQNNQLSAPDDTRDARKAVKVHPGELARLADEIRCLARCVLESAEVVDGHLQRPVPVGASVALAALCMASHELDNISDELSEFGVEP